MEEDCGTSDGIVVTSLIEGGEIIQPLEERILGRTIAEDIKDPISKKIAGKNSPVDEELTQKNNRCRNRQGKGTLCSYMPVYIWRVHQHVMEETLQGREC